MFCEARGRLLDGAGRLPDVAQLALGVPLAEMFGYATDMRSATQGRATYTMQFDRYEEVPPNIAEGIGGGREGSCVGGNESCAAQRVAAASDGKLIS